ncbi:MAG: DUF1521 domain-containing protein [Acidobacteria bacterium]|nr:DUF1521 domain-containing protein [Acidobacteriota bacterium]
MANNTVNINVYNRTDLNFGPDVFAGVNNAALDRLDDRLTGIFDTGRFDRGFNYQSGSQAGIMAGGCVVPPDPCDCCHPQGILKNEGGKITTPGGYTIEATKQHEWVITGPDGKTTKVWGDPHVAEGDGGKWDFKRNSTFVLGDGTKINVTTAPWKDGKMTVTSGLEIISGNDRVNITDIDKGKGVVGPITQDGFAHSNCFANNDVFVMGRESDDWSYQGREVTGSKDGGESFELGNNLPAGNVRPNPAGDDWSQPQQFLNQLLGYLLGNGSGSNNNTSWQNGPQNGFGSNPYYDGHSGCSPRGGGYDNNYHREFMRDSLRLVSQMLRMMDRLLGMGGDYHMMRNRSIYA